MATIGTRPRRRWLAARPYQADDINTNGTVPKQERARERGRAVQPLARTAVLTVFAVVWGAVSVVVPAAHAAPQVPARCAIATSAQAATAQSTLLRQLAIAEGQLQGATAGSPADWRLHEDIDSLRVRHWIVAQLRTALAAKEGASSASPAKWRAQESSDALCELLEI